MRKTYLERWEEFNNLIIQRDNEYVAQVLGDKTLNKLYHVQYQGKLDELIVTGYSVDHYLNGNRISLYYAKKKPTRIELMRIQNFYEAEPEYCPDFITVHVKGENYSTGFKLKKIRDKDFVYEDRGEAEKVSKELSEKTLIREKFLKIHQKPKNYNYLANGYRMLGWQGAEKHDAAYQKCRELKHELVEVSENMRGTEHNVSCPVCKIFWKYDSGD